MGGRTIDRASAKPYRHVHTAGGVISIRIYHNAGIELTTTWQIAQQRSWPGTESGEMWSEEELASGQALGVAVTPACIIIRSHSAQA